MSDIQSPDELKLKTLESKDLAGKILSELDRDDLTISDYLNRLLWVCPPSELIDQEYEILLTAKANGRRLEKHEHIRLKKVVYMGLKEAFFKMDVLSLLGGLNFDNEIRYIPWKVFNTSVLTLDVENGGGKFILISGNMGTGKTHLASILAHDCIENKNLNVLSNINFLEDNPYLKRIYSTSDLLINGIKISLRGEKWIAILDESGVWQHTQDHATKKNISWDKIYRLIRKFQGSMIFIDQRSGGFTRTLREFSHIHLHKTAKSTLKVNIFDNTLKGTYYLKYVPSTPMKFDTLDIAYFRHDIDIDKVLAKATNITGSKNQKEAIIEFLEQEKNNAKNNSLGIGDKEVAIYLREKSIELDRKLSYQDIGDLVGRSATAVNFWYREYQKNKGEKIKVVSRPGS